MTVLEQIRAANPSLELLPDEELIEKIVEQYQGDVDPDTFRESLTSPSPFLEFPTERLHVYEDQ